MSRIVTFRGKPLAEPFFESDNDFKMYSFDVSKDKFPDIKHTKYGGVTVKGELFRLSLGNEYIVTAEEAEHPKYGYSYVVKNIQCENPTTPDKIKNFLYSIITPRQTETILKYYPNIIDIVKEDRVKEINVNLLKGIGEETLTKIVNSIMDNYVYAELFSEFFGLFSTNVLKQLYDRYTSVDLVRKKLNEDPYGFLYDLNRIGFKKADNIILKAESDGKLKGIEPFLTSRQRCKSFIVYSINQELQNGNTKVKYKTLQNECIACVKDAANHFPDIVMNDDTFVCSGTVVSLRSVYNTELYVAEKLVKGLRSSFSYNFDISKYRKCEDNVELTDEQMTCLANLCKYNVSILMGFSGAGKSQSTKAIINMLKDNKKSFILMAPTGKASQVLTNYTNERAVTIHRGLGYNPMTGWNHNESNPLSEDVVIVDEFSMVDIFLFYRLICAIDFSRTKLLMIGDAAQLSSVSAGNCLHDMIDSKVIPVTALTKIFRYGEGGLMKVATDCRNRIPYLRKTNKKIDTYGSNEDFAYIQSTDEFIVDDSIKVYKTLLEQGVKPEDILITSAYNIGDYGINILNTKLQKIVNKNYGKQPYKKVGDSVFYVGDIVLQTKNDYKVKMWDKENQQEDTMKSCCVFNGETGKIIDINEGKVIIDFGDNRLTCYSRGDGISSLKLGYAISTHKSQGSSSDYVIVLSPKAHTFMLTSNLLYVAITRTRKKCYQLGVVDVINRATKKKDEENRFTNLMIFLQTESRKPASPPKYNG